MELARITLPPITAPGAVTTFYSFESGTARSVALSSMAQLLAGRDNATVPVLMIDWDTESPGLHHHFGDAGEPQDGRGGVLEFFEACRAQLALLGRGAAGADDSALAREVLEAVDWQHYVERVDQSRPLYLMRAGRFDGSYGERADQMDWDGLFKACPALFRCFGEHLAAQFAHVLVDARSGRSAAVSVCTTLLPGRLVALFTPNQRSLEGITGVVTRAIDYRCSHEDEQRPLLVYPLPCAVDGAAGARREQWRRGSPVRGAPGYQPVLEKLLRGAYGMSRVCLDSYFDEIQLQQCDAIGGAAAPHEGGADRFSLTRTFETLLEWFLPGRLPWQSRAEVALQGAIEAARPLARDGAAAVPSALLARELNRLGELYAAEGRQRQALDCFEESVALRARALGADHADTRASRANLAAQLRQGGQLPEAKFLYQSLRESATALLGADHPEALAARAGLANTLALLGEFAPALALHEELAHSCERLYGSASARTLDALAGLAETLSRHDELSRARMVYERVLEGRQRLLGTEHEDTLRCTEQLARLLSELGDLRNARKLQEAVVGARERHCGPEHRATLAAREALAEIWAAQGDLAAVRTVQEALARARECRLGSDHPDTLSTQLRLASTLGRQGELEAARRLQEHVVHLHERIHGVDDLETLRSKKLLAATLTLQGHGAAARTLEETVLQGLRGMASGPHQSHMGALDLREAILEARELGNNPETLDQKLAQLQKLIDSSSPREARELADTLRKSVLRPGVDSPVRRRGVALIRHVYQQEGDKDALLAFAQAEVSALEGALVEARVANQ
ncbi:tetratricopeptide repeat protein [Massilia glaciei]|uniref:Tetratricopeptide repeat protein n=1 Tax=Massilia glaciei TaxID=1524097 RepID=A0A2U2I6B2_9BURK|nr:tetratricopeptide repeat protein [Massilia glaciei]PWF55294.1 tetratricopeptide repeat protein [Massilia glaciei]